MGNSDSKSPREAELETQNRNLRNTADELAQLVDQVISVQGQVDQGHSRPDEGQHLWHAETLFHLKMRAVRERAVALKDVTLTVKPHWQFNHVTVLGAWANPVYGPDTS
jgi:hypothetical protein